MSTVGNEIISKHFDDFIIPGVVVEVDPLEAEALGAFEEIALSEEDAIESVIGVEAH